MILVVDNTIDVVATDYAGNFKLPRFQNSRPSVDYYTSDLSIYAAVICDCMHNDHRVVLHDERAMGKGADAVINIRFAYFLARFQEYNNVQKPFPKHLFLIMDNCCGQNKSQDCMMFYCMLSVLFYDTVTIFFFVSGHSHFIPDRVTSWIKTALKKAVQGVCLKTCYFSNYSRCIL